MASGVPRPTSAAVPVGDSELAADPSAALELYGHGLRGGRFRAPVACRAPHRP